MEVHLERLYIYQHWMHLCENSKIINKIIIIFSIIFLNTYKWLSLYSKNSHPQQMPYLAMYLSMVICNIFSILHMLVVLFKLFFVLSNRKKIFANTTEKMTLSLSHHGLSHVVCLTILNRDRKRCVGLRLV